MENKLSGIAKKLKTAWERGATDIFIVAGAPMTLKIDGAFADFEEGKLGAGDTRRLIEELYREAGRSMDALTENGDDDFSMSVSAVARYRVNAYKQRGSLAAVIRVIGFGIPDYREMDVPEIVMEQTARTSGLILVTGPAGGGKSTTLACMIDRINSTREGHIVTLEEPIEYLHRDKKCIVSQREICMDSDSFLTGLRACMRQAPDVILLGEMRDRETMSTALTAAETGHLVLSTLHTLGAANSIDRIVDAFPEGQQSQVRAQLAMLLRAVVSQQLIKGVGGKNIPVFEVMVVNDAVRNIIRERKTHQLDGVIRSSSSKGMISMDVSILQRFTAGEISRESAVAHAINTEQMIKRTSSM